MGVTLRLSLLALLVPSILAVSAYSKSQVEVPVDVEQSLRDAEAVFMRAVRLDAEGRHQEARRAFEEALDAFRVGASRRPDFAKLHYATGVVLTHLDRYDEALRAYQEAVRLKPDLAEAHLEIAATLGHLGRNDEGLHAYQEGVRLKPDFAKTHGYLEALLKPRRPITDPTQRFQIHPEISPERDQNTATPSEGSTSAVPDVSERPTRSHESNARNLASLLRRFLCAVVPGWLNCNTWVQDVSILPPRGENWFIYSQSASHVKFIKNTTKGPDHIVMALVEMKRHRDLRFRNSKEFSQHISQESEWLRAFRSFHSYNVSLDNCLGRDCVRVDFTVETFGKPYAPGSIYVLTGREYHFFHPDSPGVILKLAYSQRFRKGEKPLPIEDEVKTSFNSLVFTSVQTRGEPARESPGGVGVLVKKSPGGPHGSMEKKSSKSEIFEMLLAEAGSSFRTSPDSKRAAYVALTSRALTGGCSRG